MLSPVDQDPVRDVDWKLIPLPELLDYLVVERQHRDAEEPPALVTHAPLHHYHHHYYHHHYHHHLHPGLSGPPEELLGVVDGDGEADARANLHAVDSDRLPVQVD